MTNTVEKGHLRNAATFTELVGICSVLGGYYRPSNPLLVLPAITSQSETAMASVNSVMALLNDYYEAVNLRHGRFSELPALSSRIMSYFRSCGASDERIKDLRAYQRKFQSSSRNTSAPATPAATDGTAAPAPRRISTSQLSYDHKAQHFLSMIDILRKEPMYSPQEDDLTVDRLSQLHRELMVLTTAVHNQKIQLENARQQRNELLYQKKTGITDVAKALCKYPN